MNPYSLFTNVYFYSILMGLLNQGGLKLIHAGVNNQTKVIDYANLCDSCSKKWIT